MGIYYQSVFYSLPQLGKIQFSVDSDGNKNYTDEGDQLFVYLIQISGNYSSENPVVEIALSKANQTALTQKATNLNYWVGKQPVSGMKAAILNFYSNGCSVLVDEIKFGRTDELTDALPIKKWNDTHHQLLSVYPNPAVRGRLKMRFYTERGGEASYSVYNLTGDSLIESTIGLLQPGVYEETIELAQLPRGIFVLKAIVGQQTMRSNIVIP